MFCYLYCLIILLLLASICFSSSSGEVDLQIARLEDLIDRRALLLSSVKLRQNPNNVIEWLNRVKLVAKDPSAVIKTFAEAVITVDPFKAVGRLVFVWLKFAKYYEYHNDLPNARAVFERATNARFKTVEDLALIW